MAMTSQENNLPLMKSSLSQCQASEGKDEMEEMLPQNIWEKNGFQLFRQKRRGQIIERFLRSDGIRRILDIGCAEGYITSHISQSYEDVMGMDIDIASLKIARQKVKKTNFLGSSITHLPFKDNSIDAISLSEVIEHLPMETIERGFAEIDRILRTNGVLVISVPYEEKIVYNRCIHCDRLTPRSGHLHSLNEKMVSAILPANYQLIQKANLPNVRYISCSKIFQYFPIQFWMPINNLLGLIRKGPWLILKYTKSSN